MASRRGKLPQGQLVRGSLDFHTEGLYSARAFSAQINGEGNVRSREERPLATRDLIGCWRAFWLGKREVVETRCESSYTSVLWDDTDGARSDERDRSRK
jgi:hypothetical protein